MYLLCIQIKTPKKNVQNSTFIYIYPFYHFYIFIFFNYFFKINKDSFIYFLNKILVHFFPAAFLTIIATGDKISSTKCTSE